MPLNYPNRTFSQNRTVFFLYLWIITTRKIEPIGLNKKNSNFSRERKREKRSRDNKKKEALTTARPCHKEFACSRERGRDRLSEIIQNPIREVENPERARTREIFQPTTSLFSLPPPPSLLTRKWSGRETRVIKRMSTRNFEEVCLPPRYRRKVGRFQIWRGGSRFPEY